MALKGATVNGVDYRFDYNYLENKPISVKSVTIGTSWVGSGPYRQAVTIGGVTANTKVDVQPDSTAMSRMLASGTTALWIENDNGTLTAVAMGDAPTTPLTVQCVLTEVV